MIQAGELHERITLERIQGVGDGDWLPIAQTPDVWAAVEPIGGDNRYRVRIRYRADLRSLRDVAPGMRVLWLDRVLMVEDVIEAALHQETHLFCRDVIVNAPVLSPGGKRIKPWAG